MHETSEDLAELQRRLDESYAAAGEHIRSIFVPPLRSSAEDLARTLTGIFVINLAVVTGRGEPLVAPVDGLFYRGRLWFGLPPRSQRVRHVRARPAVSATQTEGELPSGRCLIVHGIAREVTYGHPMHAGYSRYVMPLYGLPIPDDLDNDPKEGRPREDFTGYIEPRRIFAQGFA
jgi:hypothetical protein